MKVLITGSGGREHALAWKVSQSPQVEAVFVAPGNAGTAGEPGISNLDLDVLDFAGQIEFCRKEGVDLAIVGPEAPLVAGAVDAFQAAGLSCFGPSQAAAQLEGSKSFTKAFLARHNIPTAAYGTFDKAPEAFSFAREMGLPVVIKADGLAAGKGVVIAETWETVEQTIADMLGGEAFGDAGSRIVIEEFLQGEEASFIVIADGSRYLAFASSQDHKAAYDGDRGPNTGGMGAYSPAPVVTQQIHDLIESQVIAPTIRGMAADGTPYTGFLYAGLMISPAGEPKVIEFNCRFGDPETQPIMMRLQSDLPELCLAAMRGELAGREIQFDSRVALTVVMAAGGYPGSYRKGDPISGLDIAADGKIFHAGTRLDGDTVVTNGGRVLGVTALGESVREAQDKAYQIVDQVSFADAECRRDIGYRAVAREASVDIAPST